MIRHIIDVNLGYIARWAKTEIDLVKIAKMLFPFCRKHTLPAKPLKGEMETTESGEEVNKSEVFHCRRE